MSTSQPAPVENRPNYRRPRYDHAPIAIYGAVSKRLFREWMPHLNEGEFKLAAFLIAMTLGHEKKQGDYTLGQIMHGMNDNRNGGRICEGTGLSESTFYRAKKTLQKRGLITAKTHGYAGWVFEVNPDWNPNSANVTHDGNVATIHPRSQPKTPAKKPRAAGSASNERIGRGPIDEATEAVNLTVGDSQIDRHPITDISQVATSPFHSEMVAPPSASRSSLPVKNEEDFTGKKTEEIPISPKAPLSPEAPKAKAKRPLTGDTLEREWKAAWKAGQDAGDILKTRYPARWSKVDKVNMMRVAAAWDANAYGPFADYLAFVVTSWKTIMRKHFAWMTQSPPPEQPTVGFLVNGKFLPKFIEAYCTVETLKWVGLDPRVGREVEWQMENGLSREAAILKVAQMHMEEADRKQRATDITTAKRYYEMVQISLSRARAEAVARDKYRPAAHEKESFAPAADRDPGAPIIAEHADFSAWGLN